MYLPETATRVLSAGTAEVLNSNLTKVAQLALGLAASQIPSRAQREAADVGSMNWRQEVAHTDE